MYDSVRVVVLTLETLQHLISIMSLLESTGKFKVEEVMCNFVTLLRVVEKPETIIFIKQIGENMAPNNCEICNVAHLDTIAWFRKSTKILYTK